MLQGADDPHRITENLPIMDIFDALWFECVSDYFSLVDADVSIVFDLSPMLEFLINLVRIGGNR